MSNPDFIILPFGILMDERLSFRHWRVMAAILSWQGKGIISRKMIAERTGFPESRVSAVTGDLRRLGWLEENWRETGVVALRCAEPIVWRGRQ